MTSENDSYAIKLDDGREMVKNYDGAVLVITTCVPVLQNLSTPDLNGIPVCIS